MKNILRLKIIFLFLVLCFALSTLNAAEPPISRVYSSSNTNQAVIIGTGVFVLRGVHIDEAAPNGVIKIWDSVGSTTSFSTSPYIVGGATLCIIDASGIGPQPYHGPWSIWTSSGLIFSQEGNIKFRIDYEKIRGR